MKNIVITGCSSGIGSSTATWLVRNTESTVIGIARRKDVLLDMEQTLNITEAKGKFISMPFDLADIQSLPLLSENIMKCFQHVDILINNAATILNKPFQLTTEDEFDNVFDLNVKSVYFLIRELFPYFHSGSHIINISSMGGVQGSVKFPGLSVYSASKAAISTLTECLATEFAETGIRVNAIAPGSVQTEMLSKAFPNFKAPVSADDMGAFVAKFALEGHVFFNGKILQASISTP